MSPEEIDALWVNDILLQVYRARLDDACEGDADRMVEKDGDDGTKQRRRAEFYRPIVVETLVQAGVYRRPVRERPKRKEGGE